MKKIIYLAYSLCLLFFLAGCAQQEEREIDHVVVRRDDYSLTEIGKDITKLTAPCGILCRTDDILVCDRRENCIVILNKEGEYAGKVGALGSAPLEFIRPTAIAQDQNYLYVIDSGNERIQVLDHQMSFVREIALPEPSASEYDFFFDIAVVPDGDIYLTANFLDKKRARIYRVSEDGAVIWKSPEPFFGFLMSEGEEVCSVNMLVLYETKSAWGARPGDTKLRSVTEDKDISDLPYKYSPSDFVFYESCYYCLSGLTATLDRLDENGTYLDSLVSLPPFSEGYSYLDVSSDGMFYVTDQATGSVYIVRKNDG